MRMSFMAREGSSMAAKRKKRARLKPGSGYKAQHRSKVSLGPSTTWDKGADGPANRIGLVIEDRGDTDPTTGKKINPNGVKGARRAGREGGVIAVKATELPPDLGAQLTAWAEVQYGKRKACDG